MILNKYCWWCGVEWCSVFYWMVYF